MSIFSDVLSTVFDRRYRGVNEHDVDNRPMPELVGDLLGSHGEISGMSLARQILDRYAGFDDAQKMAFFEFLLKDLDVRPEALRAALGAYEADKNRATYQALMKASEPARQEMARRLNQVPGATQQLVAMRSDLLTLGRTHKHLQIIDLDFRHLLQSWFNRGFLVLRPINWESPANILEKIIAYEAVHAIDSWRELRARLEPVDRRCFAFFHPSMADEPLIFVEVALTQGIPGSIQSVLSDERHVIDPRKADTAVFYSISNCQPGLAGISFGNSLIKQVAADLSRSLPNLKTFVTLSPIPGLMDWAKDANVAADLDDPDRLKQLAAHYLLNVKRDDGAPRDPVARFHLGNGALVEAVHAKADTSTSGMTQSAGAMVNYRYDLARISQNHERFATHGDIAASNAVRALARVAKKRDAADN